MPKTARGKRGVGGPYRRRSGSGRRRGPRRPCSSAEVAGGRAAEAGGSIGGAAFGVATREIEVGRRGGGGGASFSFLFFFFAISGVVRI